jgi:subfamily B ATP-binding cassette protein MsbA
MNTLMLAQLQWQLVMNQSGGLEMLVNEFKEIQQHQEITGKSKLIDFQHSIHFDEACFAFGNSKIIKGVSFFIPKNATVALVGESGSGKTTLTDLMSLLLKPQGGQILFDGIPADELDLASWRNKIGFVTQDTVIFDDTIANNITLWEGDYDNDAKVQSRVKHAAEQAYCDRFISELPQGYLTEIGERGVKLSGGQRQRLSIARELYKQPEILILDEATSALDSESERYIQESIDALKGKMTVVIIAHRLSTIKNADKIIVLDKGQVKEEGSFEELTSIDSRFKQMAELQRI